MLSKRISISLLAIGLMVLTSACGNADAEGPQQGWPGAQAGGTIPSVEVIQARYGALPLKERLSGTVRAENQVAIYPEISAPVVQVAVQDGAYVRKGQALVYMKDTQFKDQLRQAQATLRINEAQAKGTAASLREIKSRLARTAQLAEKQLQSEQALETLQAEVESAEAVHEQALARIAQAEANVAEQEEALRRTVVRAPISGRVGQRNAEIGMRVDTGTPLFIIGNFEMVRVEVAINDEMITLIEAGQTALITLEGMDDLVIEAKVSRISPFLEAGSYSARAEIDVPNAKGLLRPGMFVAVDVLYGESEQATLLPASALYENPSTGAQGLYVASSLSTETPLREPESFDRENPPPLTEPTPMTFMEVTVLARGSGLVGVDTVQPGDWVVTVGQNLLSNRSQDRVDARARPMTWDRVAALQEMQDQDLLRRFMEKQQRMSHDAAFGAETGETAQAADTTDVTDTVLQARPATLVSTPRP